MEQVIGLGGGCHWCTEAVFQALRGIGRVEQGFISAAPPHDSFSEAVRLRFDPGIIPLSVLLRAHLLTHASTSDHKLRGKYRSAVYVCDAPQGAAAAQALARLQAGFDKPLVTRVLALERFRPSDARFVNYRQRHADGPFCASYIDPKLALLGREFAAYLADEPPPCGAAAEGRDAR